MQFERFANLFVKRDWRSGIALFCVVFYLLFMLIYPCLPVQTPSGEAVPASRMEYLILYMSAPSAYLWQWTGGTNEITLSDRLPIVVVASGWLVPAWLLGFVAMRLIRNAVTLRRTECCILAFLIGSVLLQEIAFVVGTFFGLSSIWPMVLLLLVLSVGTMLWMTSKKCLAPWQNADDLARTSTDHSFENSWFRRTIGLLFLGTAWLGGFQLFASLVPTADVQVRSTDGWLVKHAMQDERIRAQPHNLEANVPNGFAMVDLTCSTLPGWLAGPKLDEQQRVSNRRIGSIAGKFVRTWIGLGSMLFVSLVASRLWRALPGLFLMFTYVAIPGISELTRLGRVESLWGVYACSAIAILAAGPNKGTSTQPCVLVVIIAAGAFMLGNGGTFFVALPLLCFVAWKLRFKEPSNAVSDGLYLNSRTRRLALLVVTSAVLAVPIGWHIQSLLSWMKQGDHKSSTPSVKAHSIASLDLWSSLDDLLRFLGSSTVHHLILIPLALLGSMIVLRQRTNDRHQFILGGICWIVCWYLAWWFGATEQDRDWIGILVLAILPAALGLRWLMSRTYPIWTSAIVTATLVWSALVIPVWPMSDNRVLMAYEGHSNDTVIMAKLIRDGEPVVAQARKPTHLLLLGSADDSGFECRVTSFSARQTLVPKGADSIDGSVTYVLIDWEGLRRIDGDLGLGLEQEMRRSWMKLREEGTFGEVEDDRLPSRYSLLRRRT